MTETTNAPAPLTLADKIAKSSQVASLAYEIETRKLTVEFKNSEWVYVYSDVPPLKWEELKAADSLGSYLYRNVTGGKGRSTPYGFDKIRKATGEIVATADPS